MKVWSWRNLIQKAEIPSTTKLVMFNLSCYMNDTGEGCYPSTKRQASDTGLSERAVCTHISKAKEYGLIEVVRHGFGGQKWSRNEYMAKYPEGTELGSAPYNEKALNLMQEGTEPDDIKALNDVQSNSPVELSSINTPPTPQGVSPPKAKPESKKQKPKKPKVINYSESFEEFWRQYPSTRKGKKERAYEKWQEIINENRATEQEILNGTLRYAASDEVARGYAAHATTWLNDDRWNNSYRTPENRASGQRQSGVATAMCDAFHESEW